MKKQSILMLSSLLASAILVGATFAAYAVTDIADPFGIYVTPGSLDEDTETNYVTISWGESTSKSSDISHATPGQSYKLGVYNLKASSNYTGVLSVTLTDEYPGTRPEGQKKFIDYLKIYLYEGAVNAETEGGLPDASPLLTTAVGATSMVYSSALGTPSGKEYTLYIQFDSTAIQYVDEMQDDVVDISINWDASAKDIINTSKTVYFASSWENVYLYTWGEKGYNAAYPGKELAKIGLNQYGEYIYQGLLLDGYTKMIFSNGGQGASDKTPDLVISSFDFTGGDLLFWKNDSDPTGAGHAPFNSSDVQSIKANIGTNPGPILHAWGWTVSDITSRLADIEEAGYKAVQVSPLQPLKTLNSQAEVWSMAYQPIGLSVAEKGKNDNPFGYDELLEDLCTKAKARGIDIIMDVVANHLAEGSSPRTLDVSVRNYEKTIYDNNLIHDVRNIGGEEDDYDIYVNVKGSLGGLPDLQTENSYVQERVISMLKEYIDLGVSGFRFDAAKHIETPMDGDNSSEFWPNVIGAINQYGLSVLHKAPYCYGEIMNLKNRDWNGYTKYIDVTADAYAWGIRQYFDEHDEGNVINRDLWISQGYNYAVIYSETHDNFVHNNTYGYADEWMDMEYALCASRASSSSLYFARPKDAQRDLDNTKIVIEPYEVTNLNPNRGYNNPLVKAANKLHNEFVGGTEYLSAWDSCVINARTVVGKYGAYVCLIHDGKTSVDVKIAIEGGYLPDGIYTNLVTGNDVNIVDGYAHIDFGSGVKAAILISKA